MCNEKKLGKLVIGGLLAFLSNNVLADVQFDVAYGDYFKKVCAAKNLKVVSNQIVVEGFLASSCIEDSKADFSKQVGTDIKTLLVDIDGNPTKLNVVRMFGDENNGVIGPLNGRITLVLGPIEVAVVPVPVVDTKNLKIVEPEQNGETHLPGCAGLTKVSPNECRLNGSIGNEHFAVRLDKTPLINYPSQQYFVRGITNDDMPNVNVIYRSFVMAISTTPGDFSPANAACRQDIGSAVISLPVMLGEFDMNILTTLRSARDKAMASAYANLTNIELVDEANKKSMAVNIAERNLQDYQNGKVCVLDKNQEYYVNVRPENPGCKAYVNGQLTNPNGECRVEVFANFPHVSK